MLVKLADYFIFMINNRQFHKGFTILELLIVLAIIGILTSIVLVATGDARTRGADAGIKSNLDTVRNQAEIFYLNNGNRYLPAGVIGPFALPLGTSCPNVYSAASVQMIARDKIMQNAIEKSAKLSGVSGGGSLLFQNATRCFQSVKSWAVAVVLRSGNSASVGWKSWCVDSSGQSKLELFRPIDSFLITGSGADAIATCK